MVAWRGSKATPLAGQNAPQRTNGEDGDQERVQIRRPAHGQERGIAKGEEQRAGSRGALGQMPWRVVCIDQRGGVIVKGEDWARVGGQPGGDIGHGLEGEGLPAQVQAGVGG